MVYERAYVKSLIRRRLEGEITAGESDELDAAEKVFTDEDFAGMVAEVAVEMGDTAATDVPVHQLPDFKAIRRRGDRQRSVERLARWGYWGGVAALFCFILGMSYHLFFQGRSGQDTLHLEGDCMHLASGTEIPVAESSGTILLDDSVRIRVDAEHSGLIGQVGDVSVSRTPEGILRLTRKASPGAVRQRVGRSLLIYTGARQQCVVELEDGTRVRMNAQSSLHYPITRKDTLYIGFFGEGYVQRHARSAQHRLVIVTGKGKIALQEGDFVFRAADEYTKAVLKTGAIELLANNRDTALQLVCPNDFGMIRSTYALNRSRRADTLVTAPNVDFEAAAMWTKTMRTYENVPLRAFVEEMSRWEGFTIKDWNCIPKDKTINIVVCYRNDRQEVLAAIRHAGVMLYQEKGTLSFCPEDIEKQAIPGYKVGDGHRLATKKEE